MWESARQRAEGTGVSFVLPAIRYGVRPAPRRRPVATTLTDRLLGVSKRRRQAAYLAFGGGMKLLQPMLRRLGVLLALIVLVPLVSLWIRLVF